MCELNGFRWEASEKFEIERILDRKVERRVVGKVRRATARARTALPLATANLRPPSGAHCYQGGSMGV